MERARFHSTTYGLCIDCLLRCTLYTLDLYTLDGQAVDTVGPSNSERQRFLARCFHDSHLGVSRVMKTAEEPIRPLPELLPMFGSFQRSDNRDKIYALLGISNEAEGIPPNHRKSTVTVYREVVHWLLEKHGSLDVLNMACYHNGRDLSHAS